MAAQFYASITADASSMKNVSHSGTSGTAGDWFEVRMGDGTNTPTRSQCLMMLGVIRRHIIQGGIVPNVGDDIPPAP